MNSTHHPVHPWVLGSYQGRCTRGWCYRSMVSAKRVRNQMVPPCAEWWCDVSLCSATLRDCQMKQIPRTWLSLGKITGLSWET